MPSANRLSVPRPRRSMPISSAWWCPRPCSQSARRSPPAAWGWGCRGSRHGWSVPSSSRWDWRPWLCRSSRAPDAAMASADAGDVRLTLVLGGARSGKSRYAESLITARAPPWIYLATAEAGDDDMAQRIAGHRARRNAGWQTVEAPHDLARALDAAATQAPLLVDCMTLWLTNRMLAE